MTSSVVAIGSKGVQFVRRLADVELLAYYPSLGDNPTQADILPVLSTVMEQYVGEMVDEVVMMYTVSRSSISQVAVSQPLLPADMNNDGTVQQAVTNMNFEPDAETVIQQLATRLIEVQIWQVLLESLASEHAMRMLAMKSATDNASELIDDYTLEYNTARQAAITQEISEITGGAEALK